MIYENVKNMSGGIGGTNIKPAGGTGLGGLFASRDGGVRSAVHTPSLPISSTTPVTQSKPFPFAFTGAANFVRGVQAKVFHSPRRGNNLGQ